MLDHQGKSERDPFASRIILVVEDDRELAEFLGGFIGMFVSYDVRRANNAFQAMSILSNVRPDLFLFDYLLPGINGIELYHRLHCFREFASVPVLFLSAVAPKEAFEERHLP